VDDQASSISLREINAVNRGGIERLTVTADQSRYVASVADSLHAGCEPSGAPVVPRRVFR
jgi:hypothetical protein